MPDKIQPDTAAFAGTHGAAGAHTPGYGPPPFSPEPDGGGDAGQAPAPSAPTPGPAGLRRRALPFDPFDRPAEERS